MQLCNLSHTDHPACAVDECVQTDGRMLRACGYTRTHVHATGPRGTHSGALEYHHRHHHHHHLSGAGGSREVLRQYGDRGNVLSRALLAGFAHPGKGAEWVLALPARWDAGTSHPWLLPSSRTSLRAPSLQCRGGRAHPSPYSTRCRRREERCCQPIRPGRAPLAAARFHLKAVGPCRFGGGCGRRAGQPAPSGGCHAKSPQVPTCIFLIYFVEEGQDQGRGLLWRLSTRRVSRRHVSGCAASPLLHQCTIPHPTPHLLRPASHIPHPISHVLHPASHTPSPKSCIPHPATHTPYPVPCIPHPTWELAEVGALPGGTGCWENWRSPGLLE